MFPHEFPHVAVYAVATKNHITSLDIAVCKMDSDPIFRLDDIVDAGIGFDERLVGQSIIQNLQEVASFKSIEAAPMAFRR